MKERAVRTWGVFCPPVKRYWFDALLLAGLGLALAVSVIDIHKRGTDAGPEGPLWFDVLATVAFMLPLFWRRRYPFGAPVAVCVVISASSFVDGRLIAHDVVPWLLGMAIGYLFGSLDRLRQAVAGLVILV